MHPWIYLDNAATTPVKPEVFEAMEPYFQELYGNPSGFSSFADSSKEAIETARKTVADFIGAKPSEIYFTSGGTESDNWALKSVTSANRKKGNHIITSAIEHHAVLKPCEWLEKNGYEVTYVGVDANGIIDLEALQAAIRPDTTLISVMYANNEIGTLQPIKEIGAIAHAAHIPFHTDAVQAYGHVPINVNEDDIDLLSASAHKFNGPKGVGFLYVRKGTKIDALMQGGEQERNKRPGTYNTPGIVGLGKATEVAAATLDERAAYETKLRDHLIERVLAEIPYCRLIGDPTRRLPNNANISFQYIEGESILIMLDQNGICAASGSACASASLDPSNVLLAIGLPHEIAHGSIRMTVSEDVTMDDIDYVADELKSIVERLRSMSPLYEDFVKESA